jgi:thiol-disulfide isomerase/thioredoxin
MRNALTHRYALRIVLVAFAGAILLTGVLNRAHTLQYAPLLPKSQMTGPRVPLGKLRGQPIVIVFWASWCPGCHREASAVERFATSSRGRGRVIGIDYSDPARGAAYAFLAQYHWTFEVRNDPDGSSGDAYGVVSLPTTIIVNARSQIIHRLLGPQTFASLDAKYRAALRH